MYDEGGFPAIPADMDAHQRAVLQHNRALLVPEGGESDFYRRSAPPDGIESERNTSSFVTARNTLTDSAPPLASAPPTNSASASVTPPKRKGFLSKISGLFRSLKNRFTSKKAPKPKKYPWMKDRVWNAPRYKANIGRRGGPSGGRQWTDDPNVDMPQSHIQAWDANTSAAFEAMNTRRRGDRVGFAGQRKDLEAKLRERLQDAPGSKRGDANRVSDLMRTMLNESLPSRDARGQRAEEPSGPTIAPGGLLDGIPVANNAGSDDPSFIPPAVRAVFPDFQPEEDLYGKGIYSQEQPSINSDATLSNWAEDQQYMDEQV